MTTLLTAKLIAIPVLFLAGAGLHFLYKYGGKKKWMAIISPVNESIWEHLKIAFYPALAYAALLTSILQLRPENFWAAEVVGIYIMLGFILIVEWIYPAIIKRNILAIDLLVFFVAIALGQLCAYGLQVADTIQFSTVTALCLVAAQTIIFALFSFLPPRLGLFRDSTDGKYGVK